MEGFTFKTRISLMLISSQLIIQFFVNCQVPHCVLVCVLGPEKGMLSDLTGALLIL